MIMCVFLASIPTTLSSLPISFSISAYSFSEISIFLNFILVFKKEVTAWSQAHLQLICCNHQCSRRFQTPDFSSFLLPVRFCFQTGSRDSMFCFYPVQIVFPGNHRLIYLTEHQ